MGGNGYVANNGWISRNYHNLNDISGFVHASGIVVKENVSEDHKIIFRIFCKQRVENISYFNRGTIYFYLIKLLNFTRNFNLI